MCTAPPLQDAPPGVSGSPAQDNIMLWNAVIFGPPDTIFEVDPKIYTHACRLLLYSNHCVLGRHLQADAGVRRGVPEQAAGGEVLDEDVPPQHLH